MYLRLSVSGKPYCVVATSADGTLEAVFGPSARIIEWFRINPSGFAGTYNGFPVVVGKADLEAINARHGLSLTY